MAGPTTEYLATQIDALRKDMAGAFQAIEGVRRDAIDEIRSLKDTLAEGLAETRQGLADQFDTLRREVRSSMEALVSEQTSAGLDIARLQERSGDLVIRADKTFDVISQTRQGIAEQFEIARREAQANKDQLTGEHMTTRLDVARLQVQTAQLTARFDGLMALGRKILFTLVGIGVTVLGAAGVAIWNGSRLYHLLEQHDKRIEKLEEGAATIQRLEVSVDRIQKTLDANARTAKP